MKSFRNISIRRKLMLITMLTSSVALLLSAVGFIGYELKTFRQRMISDLSSEADLIAAQSTATLVYDRPDEAYSNLKVALHARPYIIAACLYRGNRIFTNYPPAAPAARLWPIAPVDELPRFENGQLILFRPIISDGQTNGAIYLRADSGELTTRLKNYVGVVGLVMVASFLASLFLSSRLQRVISEPVVHLAATAQKVSQEKNYSVRADKTSDDELGQLIDGFNAMLGQIQQRDADLQKARDELEIRVKERTGELQQQLSRISLLNRITYAVAARQDLDSIVLVVLQQLEDNLPLDYGAAYLFDAENDKLTALVRGPKSRPLAEQLLMPKNIPLDETPYRPCLDGEMVYVPDTSRVDLPIPRKLASAGLTTKLAAPLIVESKVFGLLVLARRATDGFSAAERDFIRGLSAHVALAIHQAQLYEDLHKAYNDLRQTQQAVMQQQRLQALGQMASGIAHDVNNALSPIVAYADLLQQTETNLSPNAKRVLGHIKTAGDDIAHIVARMREFYRQRDEFEQFVLIQINDLAQQVVDMTRPRWRDIPQSRSIAMDVQTKFDKRLPEVDGNASELREALTNLLLNAVDAMPTGGLIIIRTRTAGLSDGAETRKKQVVLEVIDNGIGMNEETRRRCLEPFFSTKGKRGTGLGLAMVYGVMERHNGTIEIDSEVGKGTTMRLIFPAGEPAEPGKRKAVDAPVDLPPLKILCIDDEPLLRDLMKEILENDGHTVQVADGGQSGIAAFRAALTSSQPFDVVITDLGMPHLNGRQVAHYVKLESPPTPVIMLTGWGALMKAQGDIPAQVDGVLSKPPRIQEIRQILLKCWEK